DPSLRPRVTLTGSSQVVATATSGISVGALAALIQQAGGSLGRALPIINGQTAVVPNLSLATLANNPAVQHLALDRLILGAMERTGTTVGAPSVRHELGVDGSGIGVAIID